MVGGNDKRIKVKGGKDRRQRAWGVRHTLTFAPIYNNKEKVFMNHISPPSGLPVEGEGDYLHFWWEGSREGDKMIRSFKL